MISRRDLILAGACTTAAVGAYALSPRQRLSLMGTKTLEDLVPPAFGTWTSVPSGQVLQPREEGSLSAKLYQQVLTRVYQDSQSRTAVMLAIAYGDVQSDLLQLHRPEVCYRSFGFELSDIRGVGIPLKGGAAVPGKRMIAQAPGRTENITYFTRIGDFLPTSASEQRWDKLKMAFDGLIPDGILVRSSFLSADIGEDLNGKFLADLVMAVPAESRPVFLGRTLSEAVRQAAS